MKLTAIIRKYDSDARQMKTQGGSSEASLALERAEKEEMRQRASQLEKEVARKMISLDKAEAAAEIAASRRQEAESEKERAIELLEKKAADVKESRSRVSRLATLLLAACLRLCYLQRLEHGQLGSSFGLTNKLLLAGGGARDEAEPGGGRRGADPCER